jgi:hypothetical protein
VQPVQQEQFMESMPYGNPFETKDLVCHARKLVATPMLTMLPCPLGGFTLVRSYSPLDIIKIKSFRIIRHGRSSTD